MARCTAFALALTVTFLQPATQLDARTDEGTGIGVRPVSANEDVAIMTRFLIARRLNSGSLPDGAETPPPSGITAIERRVTTAMAGAGMVTACGSALCLDGRPWRLHGASVLAGLDDPASTVGRASQAGLNAIRIVNFLDEENGSADAEYSEWHWERVDRLVAAAGANNLKVILDLSTFRNLLMQSGRNPYTHDWASFIAFAANRINTVSGLRYGSDPTIAVVAIAGEVEPINTPDNVLGVTTAQVTAFFTRAFAEWRVHDEMHVLASGGLLHFDWDSGVDWRGIFRAADICSIHNYSPADSRATPVVAAYCADLGKPWITEEFGMEQSLVDAARARSFADMYDLQKRNGAAGAAFWNLGPQVDQPTFDVSEATPLTWDVVRLNAP